MQQRFAAFAGKGVRGNLVATLHYEDRDVDIEFSLMNSRVDQSAELPEVVVKEGTLTSVLFTTGTNVIGNPKICHSAAFGRSDSIIEGRRQFKCTNNEKSRSLRERLRGCVDVCAVPEPKWS